MFEFLGLPVWLTNSAPADPWYLRLHTGIHLAAYLSQTGSLSAADPLTQTFVVNLAAELTRRIKGTKAMVDGEFMIFAVEMPAAASGCMPKAELLTAVLPRMREMIGAALSDFAEKVTLRGIEVATESARHGPQGTR